MKISGSFFISMLLCCSAALAGFSGSDDFNDGTINTNLWDEPVFIPGIVEESFSEMNGHLHFATTIVDDERAILPWKALAPFYRDWTITVTAALPDFENTSEQQYDMGLEISPHSIDQLISNRLAFAMSRNEANQKVFSENYVTNSIEVHDRTADRTSDTAMLRLQWETATSNLYTFVSIDGGSTWTNYWEPIADPFSMSPFDYFSCSIYGSCKGREIAISDNLYCDDFEAVIEGRPPLTGTDDFNDNIRDSSKWFPLGNLLNETSSRLEYTAAGTYGEFGVWIWTPNEGSCMQNWSITIDAHNSSIPLTADQNGNIEIAVFKDWEKSFWVGLAAEDPGGGTNRKIDVGWNIGDDDIELKLPIDSDSATLRIAYDSTSGTLFGQYDIGDGFVSVTNFNTDSWGLVDTDSLSVWVGGYSDNLVISSGQIYADNFEAVTLPNNASITNYHSVASGFKLEWIPVSGWDSVVKYSTDLVNMPFTNLSSTLPYPLNIYTDTVHGAEDQCFYRVDLEP